MGRTTNEKCWACSLLTATEARKLHGENGDECWQDDTCHSRRSYYRRGRGRSQIRKSAIDEIVGHALQKCGIGSDVIPSLRTSG